MIEQSVDEIAEAMTNDPILWAKLMLDLQKANRDLVDMLQKYAAKTATPLGNGGH